MTSITTRIITIALATLALATSVASAMPIRDNVGVQTSSLAGTTSAPAQDLRNADQRAPGIEAVPAQQPKTMAPVVRTQPQPQPATADNDGPSPLVFILPSVLVIAMLVAASTYALTTRPVRRSPA
jgi:hypothetical protein